MATFPTAIISFTDKTNSDLVEASHINTLQDEVVALETKVGINSSADTSSLDYLKNLLYPIGTVYTNYSDSTNPGTLFGFGTWVAIEGEVVVGYKSGDADFGTPSGAVGAKTVSIAHTHTFSDSATTGSENNTAGVDGYSSDGNEIADKGHEHSVTVSGTTGAMSANATPSVIQPSRICYVWRRTA